MTNLRDLQIIGYASNVDSTRWPMIVSPVYRSKDDPYWYLVPPYFEYNDFLYGARKIYPGDLADFCKKGYITMLAQAPIQAEKSMELWFDSDGTLQYTPAEEASRRLGQIAEQAIDNAVAALWCGNLKAAKDHSNLAIKADSRRVESYAIHTVADGEKAEVMLRLCSTTLGKDAFQALVKYYANSIDIPAQCKERKTNDTE